MHESGFAVQDGSGDATIVGIARDITGRKLAQEALRQSEQRYRSLFEGSQDAVYVTTPGGQVMDCNDATLDLLGYTREEMLRLNVRDSYVDPRDRERLQEIMMRQGAVRDYDVKLRRRDGVEIDCVITSTLWRSKNGEVIGYHGIARDVTWRRRLEREILSAGVREQRRIGQDLHDGLGQRLTGIAFFRGRWLRDWMSARSPEKMSRESLTSSTGRSPTCAVWRGDCISWRSTPAAWPRPSGNSRPTPRGCLVFRVPAR